ncbi:TIGR03915 family putative DNA repair protein [Coprobacter secundus]|uniref:DNA metabolism protein n=1 Tax=Coprobacter secundus subsp. similis TaxID=2751153 RepID=A0A7G1HSJ5_9BACT|nr:TIGR03915 family putative DNA repair protein [Coprobacter secundus]BCI62705.1 DNA metabolism protein [Coprobacter secundus subsp. similis]
MTIFIYDKTFEGLLTCIFDAYFKKSFPDFLLSEKDSLPLFYDELITIYTDNEKSSRVWICLQHKLSKLALSCLAACWLSELPNIDIIMFRYIHKVIDAKQSIELNFGDPDVLEISKIGRKVGQEKGRIIQFLRFQKTIDGIYFAAIEPLYNVLSLVIEHLKRRFKDQKWLIYDMKRNYGYYYDLSEVKEITFDNLKDIQFISGLLNENIMDKDEKLFQQLWKEYFKATTIQERINPKLHRQNMPVRFWKYLIEKH